MLPRTKRKSRNRFNTTLFRCLLTKCSSELRVLSRGLLWVEGQSDIFERNGLICQSEERRIHTTLMFTIFLKVLNNVEILFLVVVVEVESYPSAL